MNPFEIRAQLLSQAQAFLTEQYHAQMKTWEFAKKNAQDAEELLPSFPTIDEVVEKAIELNKFISGTVEAELVRGVKKLHKISSAAV